MPSGSLEERSWLQRPTPPTDLIFAMPQSFGVSYDSSDATVGLEERHFLESIPGSGDEAVDQTVAKHYTDYLRLAKQPIVERHCAAILKLVGLMNLPYETRCEIPTARLQGGRPASTGSTSAEVKTKDAKAATSSAVVSGTSIAGTAVNHAAGQHQRADAISANATTNQTTPRVGSSLIPASTSGTQEAIQQKIGQPQNCSVNEAKRRDIDLLFEENGTHLAELCRLQDERVGQSSTEAPSGRERKLAASVRKNLQKMWGKLQPRDALSVKKVRDALAVQTVDPRDPSSISAREAIRKRRRAEEDKDGIYYMNMLGRSANLLQVPSLNNSVLQCENCGGCGLRWIKDTPYVNGSLLCHSCGLYQSTTGRPRPIAFTPLMSRAPTAVPYIYSHDSVGAADKSKNKKSRWGSADLSDESKNKISTWGTGDLDMFSEEVVLPRSVPKRHLTGAPKRPTTAFMLFSQNNRKRIAQSAPGKTPGEVSAMVGAAWRNLAVSEKEEYEKQYEEAMHRYTKEMAAFKAK